MTNVEKSVRSIIRNCLGISSTEALVIVAEESLSTLGEAAWKCAKRITKKTILTKYSSQNSKPDLPKPILHSFTGADALLVLSPKTISQSKFDQARRNGTRIVLLDDTSSELLERLSHSSYLKVANVSRRVADLLSIGKNVRVQSPAGTDVAISIARIKGVPDTGLATRAGELGILPAGEACVFLNSSNCNGRIVLDRIAGHKKPFKYPVVLNLQKGYITQIKGKNDAELLRKVLRKYGKPGRNITELGVGTNDKYIFGHSAREDEKVLGNAHITIGQRRISRVQGKVTQAIKGIILKPSIAIDGRKIMEEGVIIV